MIKNLNIHSDFLGNIPNSLRTNIKKIEIDFLREISHPSGSPLFGNTEGISKITCLLYSCLVVSASLEIQREHYKMMCPLYSCLVVSSSLGIQREHYKMMCPLYSCLVVSSSLGIQREHYKMMCPLYGKGEVSALSGWGIFKPFRSFFYFCIHIYAYRFKLFNNIFIAISHGLNT